MADMKLNDDKLLRESIKQFQSATGKWSVESLIGEGSFGKVYKIRRQEFGKTFYSAIKIISIPYDENEIRQMRNEGLNEASIQDALQSLVADIINEIEIMSGFRGNSNIVSYEDHKVVEKPDRIGWDIMIRMELLRNLSDHAAESPMPAAEVVKLGIHICRALELCAQRNIIHRDIKPDNIFVSPYGEYKLGDFGIARQIERTMSGLSKKGTYSYMAPEVYKGEKYGSGVDIYSLGVVMYTLLNKNRGPFLPDYPMKIMPDDRDKALEQRMSGEPFPVLKEVSSELNALLRKACAYDRDQRFADPAEMSEALLAIQAAEKKEERFTKGGAGHLAGQPMEQALGSTLGQEMYSTLGQKKGDKGIHPPTPEQAPEITGIMPIQAELGTRESVDQSESTAAHTEDRPKNKKKRLLVVGLALSAVVLLLAAGWAVYYTQRDQSNSPNSPWLAVNLFLNGQEDQSGSEDEGAIAGFDENGSARDADGNSTNDNSANGNSANWGIGAATDSIPLAEESIKKDGITQYAIIYNHAENGGASVSKATAYFAGNAEVDLTPTAAKGNGWEFVGWNTNKNATTGLRTMTMPEAGVVLYAIYKKTLTATFKDYSGTAPITRTDSVTIYNKAANGNIIVPAQNTYTGWQSRGWSTATAAKADVMVSSGSYTISTNLTFYGLYQRILTLNYLGIKTLRDEGTQYANSSNINARDNPTLIVDPPGPNYVWWDPETNSAAGKTITLTANKILHSRDTYGS